MILIIKHVPHEDGGTIAEFFNDVKVIELSKGEVLPDSVDDLEAVFMMGGPMNVYEEYKYPFLKDEDRFIKMLIEKEIPFFGVCLGAQLLAKACGVKVYKANIEEIGWFNVELTEEGVKDPLFFGLPKKLTVFQWHGDTFDIPSNGVLLAKGDIANNQAFRVGTCAYGLQFHIEITDEIIKKWFENEAEKYRISDKNKFKKQALRIYKNFLRIYAQKLGNLTLYRRVIDPVEKKLIENVLDKTDGNQIQAAEILGINRNTLRSKIRKLGIDSVIIRKSWRRV